MAHDEQEQARNTRKAAAAYFARVEDRFGVFFRSASSRADFDDRVRYASDELVGLATATVEEFGGGEPTVLYQAALETYEPASSTEKTASFDKEAKPRMCPFHKDVVDISLASGDPSAGFKALESQWGKDRHCEGEGYKGESCRFKPQMTTQAFWDDRKDKAAEKRRLREEQQAELDESQGVEEVDVDEVADSPTEPIQDSNESPAAEGAEVIDFPSSDSGDSAPEAAEAPMSMAASTATFQDAHLATETTGLGGPTPKIDKRKWTPATVPAIEGLDDPTGKHPTERKDIVTPGLKNPATNEQPLKEIGEKGALEKQDVTKDFDSGVGTGGTWTKGPGSAVSHVAADSVAPRCPRCNSATTGMLDGAQSYCHACANIWEPGAVKEAAAPDVNRNPIIDMMTADVDGFVPDHVAARAILAHKRR